MTMARALNPQEVQSWLRGQRAAQERIARERARFLQQLRPEESLRIYLELWELRPNVPASPSPVLVSMRRALACKATKRS